MARIIEDPLVSELKKLALAEKLVLGTDMTIKAMQKGTVGKIYLSSNCPEQVKNKVLSLITNSEVIQTEKTNEELGIACKKPFAVSVAGVKK